MADHGRSAETMSWRTGSALFLEIWPLIEKKIADREEQPTALSASG
jgi:hypothetical protein